MKCKNCNQASASLIQTGKWYWIRCFCGFHTSSYLSYLEAYTAWNKGEQYINGNKLLHNGYECFRGEI